jgi:hypothetical protein
MKKLATTALVLALATGMAYATTTVYDSQGFESPAFTTGALDGQGGFTGGSANGGTAPVVTTTPNPTAGGQAVQLVVGDTQGDASSIDFEFAPVTVDSGTIVTVSFDIFRNAPATDKLAQNLWWWWNDAGTPTYGLQWDAGSVLPFGFDGQAKSAPSVFGQFANLTQVWDFTTGKATSFYNGQAVDTNFGMSGITKLSGWGFNFAHESDTGTGADTAYIDNFKITIEQVPEPGSMLALGSGLVGLVGFVTRRRR